MSNRYTQQIILPELGAKGQKRLHESRVLVVGAGGLGAPVLFYLAAAGVGTIAIIDHDTVELSNLQRQILFCEKEIGHPKATAAAHRLNTLNSNSRVIAHPKKLTQTNAKSYLEPYDLIFDCTDNLRTKYILNDACFLLNKPLISASLLRFRGQITLFHAQASPCLRCLFPEAQKAPFENCQTAGVIGATAGILASWQALEGIKWLAHLSPNLLGWMLMVDTQHYVLQRYKINKDPACLLCALGSTNLPLPEEPAACTTSLLTAPELKALLANYPSVLLIDVRTEEEHKAAHIGGINIPLAELPERLQELSTTKRYVLYCQKGIRSQQALSFLKKHGFDAVEALAQGLEAW